MDINNGRPGIPVKTYACHNQGGNQIFGLTQTQKIITNQEFCIGVHNNLVVSVNCMESSTESQRWKYDIKVYQATNLALSYIHCFGILLNRRNGWYMLKVNFACRPRNLM